MGAILMSFSRKRMQEAEKLYRQRISEKICTVRDIDFEERLLQDLEKRPDGEKIRVLLGTPIGFLPKKYRDAYYLLFSKEEEEIPVERRIRFEDSNMVYDRENLKPCLINVIRKHLLKTDADIKDTDIKVIPYFSMLDDVELITGFIVFFKSSKKDKFIEEIGLFSFDTENRSYGAQVWKDFDNTLREFLSEGWTVSWFAFKQNKACKHYDKLLRELGGEKEEVIRGYRYWFPCRLL